MKFIINGKEYSCKGANPRGELRDMLIDAQLNGWTIETKEG